MTSNNQEDTLFAQVWGGENTLQKKYMRCGNQSTNGSCGFGDEKDLGEHREGETMLSKYIAWKEEWNI